MALSTANRTNYTGYTAPVNDAVSSRRGRTFETIKKPVVDIDWLPWDFDNPLVDNKYEARTGITNTTPTRTDPPAKTDQQVTTGETTISGNSGNTGTGNTGLINIPVPNDDARNLAYLEDQLRYMPGQLDRINQAQRNREGNIDNDYTLGLNQTNQAWGRAEQDHNLATEQRLKSRQRQVGVADEDFKKQNDAYGRYFSRIGAGSSSASQYAVPTLLSRAASKIRNEIEDTNQENAQLQTTAFNRAKEDKENNLSNLERERNRQKQAALSEFESKRSEYQKALADMQRQREYYRGRSYADVTAAAREAMEAAERHANEAVRAGQVTEGIKVNPIDYKAADQKGFEYDATQTKVETAPQEEDTANDAYSKYFRDEEERKKNSNLGWIAKQA